MQKREKIGVAIIAVVFVGLVVFSYLFNSQSGESVLPETQQPLPVETQEPAPEFTEPPQILPQTHKINLGEDYADPQHVTVFRGDTVVWTNKGANRRRFWIDEKIYSDLLEPGESYSYSFPSEGEHTFRDVFNGKVKGTIKVQQPPSVGITGYFLRNVPHQYRGVIGAQLVVQAFILVMALLISIYIYGKK